jgi:hypothetical protein
MHFNVIIFIYNFSYVFCYHYIQLYIYIYIISLLLNFSRKRVSLPLNVYTVQNPRRRVVSVKTSQMRTICTLIWRESCLLVYIFTSAFILGWCIFVDMHFPWVIKLFKIFLNRNKQDLAMERNVIATSKGSCN